MEEGGIAQNEQFHFFPTMFSMESISENPLIATFQLSSEASLNLGWSQNGILGKGLNMHSAIGTIAFASLVKTQR